jgi:inorganic pyrophosphatase
MHEMRLHQIQHFFEHYKDLEAGKWVKVGGWEGPEAARQEVRAGIASYAAARQTKAGAAASR